jgi:hypothetical protein
MFLKKDLKNRSSRKVKFELSSFVPPPSQKRTTHHITMGNGMYSLARVFKGNSLALSYRYFVQIDSILSSIYLQSPKK